MASAGDFLQQIEAEEQEGATRYEDLSDGLRASLESSNFAPNIGVRDMGLGAVREWLGAFG
jgi:hypothetical protein